MRGLGGIEFGFGRAYALRRGRRQGLAEKKLKSVRIGVQLVRRRRAASSRGVLRGVRESSAYCVQLPSCGVRCRRDGGCGELATADFFFGPADLFFGLEPVVELGARLIAR
ncbi:MAG: hypothetical protein DMG57_10900 [Acidobacteria bacterium]|nr:MAG: hypothetical protein DMG57_10900 [Acidobacteriota bacterium]